MSKRGLPARGLALLDELPIAQAVTRLPILLLTPALPRALVEGGQSTRRGGCNFPDRFQGLIKGFPQLISLWFNYQGTAQPCGK